MNPILVLEDDSGDALVLKSRLATQEYEVVLAEVGARALALVRERPVRAVLVSARLKRGLDAIEVCRRMRAVPELNLVPILVYNQENGIPENCVRAFEAGANALVLGTELPTLEHELLLALRMSARIQELTEALRTFHDQPRRPQGERARGEHEAAAGRETAEQLGALRELAQGRPDGMLLVDSQGTVQHADRGAIDLLGSRPEGRHLGSLVQGCGLEAFVRDAQTETREGFRFDLPARKGRGPRALTATVVPLVVQQGASELPRKVVLFHDTLRRRIAAEALRTQEPGIPRVEQGPLLEAARSVYRPSELRGSSPAMRELRAAVARATSCREPVLILGEPGTGRERVARTLHYSGVTTGAFQHLRCVGISPENLESEIFGSARNPARGLQHDRPGLLHLAQDGLLYLDEITALPLPLQRRLLEFLQSGAAARAGASRSERLEVRIVASTGRELAPLCKSGAFLSELAERLAATAARRAQGGPAGAARPRAGALRRRPRHPRDRARGAARAARVPLAGQRPGARGLSRARLRQCRQARARRRAAYRGPAARAAAALRGAPGLRSRPGAPARERARRGHAHGRDGTARDGAARRAQRPELPRAAALGHHRRGSGQPRPVREEGALARALGGQRRQARGGQAAQARQEHDVPQAEALRDPLRIRVRTSASTPPARPRARIRFRPARRD
jgi:DNA-binding NtrC family response regulator